MMALMNVEIAEAASLANDSDTHILLSSTAVVNNGAVQAQLDASKAEATSLHQRYMTAGAGEGTLWVEFKDDTDPPGNATYHRNYWQVKGTKSALSKANDNMRMAAEKITTQSQQAQLQLQTLMGRYNGAFELVTAAIKRAETQSEAAVTNFKK
jgi:hypothetical protein